MADLWGRILADALVKLGASTLKPTGATALLGSGLDAPFPSLRVYITEDSAHRNTGAPRGSVNLRTAKLEVECRGAGTTTVTCYAAVAPYVAWARALDGVVLDGAVREAVETGTILEMVSKDRPYILATVHFDVLYQQKVGDAASVG